MGSSTAKGIISQIIPPVNSKNILRYLPDDILTKNKIVYDKKKMNGKYQVGSGRIVTFTHDSPFIYKDDTTSESNSQEENENNSSTESDSKRRSRSKRDEKSAAAVEAEAKAGEIAKKWGLSEKKTEALGRGLTNIFESVGGEEVDMAFVRRQAESLADNIIVTEFEPTNIDSYLSKNKIVYDKKKMNGKYQVGSGRIVTITHDNPFIYKDDTTSESNSQEENGNNSSTEIDSKRRSRSKRDMVVSEDDGYGEYDKEITVAKLIINSIDTSTSRCYNSICKYLLHRKQRRYIYGTEILHLRALRKDRSSGTGQRRPPYVLRSEDEGDHSRYK